MNSDRVEAGVEASGGQILTRSGISSLDLDSQQPPSVVESVDWRGWHGRIGRVYGFRHSGLSSCPKTPKRAKRDVRGAALPPSLRLHPFAVVVYFVSIGRESLTGQYALTNDHGSRSAPKIPRAQHYTVMTTPSPLNLRDSIHPRLPFDISTWLLRNGLRAPAPVSWLRTKPAISLARNRQRSRKTDKLGCGMHHSWK
ncbi:hypothetical protein BDW68DRAFT_16866 [Aspergillus falconensis]